MYIANAKILRLGPNATYILLISIGGSHRGVVQILAFLDTNMLVLPTQISAFGGMTQHKAPTLVEYRL